MRLHCDTCGTDWAANPNVTLCPKDSQPLRYVDASFGAVPSAVPAFPSQPFQNSMALQGAYGMGPQQYPQPMLQYGPLPAPMYQYQLVAPTPPPSLNAVPPSAQGSAAAAVVGSVPPTPAAISPPAQTNVSAVTENKKRTADDAGLRENDGRDNKRSAAQQGQDGESQGQSRTVVHPQWCLFHHTSRHNTPNYGGHAACSTENKNIEPIIKPLHLQWRLLSNNDLHAATSNTNLPRNSLEVINLLAAVNQTYFEPYKTFVRKRDQELKYIFDSLHPSVASYHVREEFRRLLVACNGTTQEFCQQLLNHCSHARHNLLQAPITAAARRGEINAPIRHLNNRSDELSLEEISHLIKQGSALLPVDPSGYQRWLVTPFDALANRLEAQHRDMVQKIAEIELLYQEVESDIHKKSLFGFVTAWMVRSTARPYRQSCGIFIFHYPDLRADRDALRTAVAGLRRN